jgi:hypothetical protein
MPLISGGQQPRMPATASRYFFLAEAFFEAFSGSTVLDPAKPRRSRGGALDFEIIT